MNPSAGPLLRRVGQLIEVASLLADMRDVQSTYEVVMALLKPAKSHGT